MTFSDASAWTFYPFDEPNTPGKISTINDRNGNSVEFDYGAGGLLTAIHDSLGRETTIIYNADGLIDAITDFTGRTISYGYTDPNVL